MMPILTILRYHIILIAMAAALVFGWLFTGAYWVSAALIGGLDWLYINLLNRVTDLDEDLANGIPLTAAVARWRRPIVAGCFLTLGASLLFTHWLWPALTPLRLAVQAIGLAYNYKLIPTPGGLRRFKEIYFFKNFMSAVLFVLTGFLYPLALAGWAPASGWWPVLALLLYFVPFELTYEILYDLRDLEGDRLLGVPTYPAVHGAETSLRIIDALLALSAAVVIGAFLGRVLGVRELGFVLAPLIQLVFYRARLRRGPLTSKDCIELTHLGTALLLVYLAGNRLWLLAGLPPNIYLGG